MQTRTYGSLFELIRSLAGVNEFTSEENADISRFINRRYFQAYNTSQNWVRYLAPSELRYLQPKKYTITFNASGDATAPKESSITKDFLWVGMFGDSPVYSTIDFISSTVSFAYVLFKDTTTYNGDFVLKKGNAVGGSTTNPSTNVVTLSTTGINLYQSIDVVGVDGITDSTKELPYAHLVQFFDNSLNFPVEGNFVITPFDNFIPFDEKLFFNVIQKNTIGELLRMHRKLALVNDSSLEYDFYVDSDGAHILNIGNTADNSVFVTYKKTFTPFTTSSDFTETSTDVPAEFFDYIIYSVLADFYTGDGQTEKALIAEQAAEKMLEKELFKIDIKSNNNSINRKFSTYVNRQSRWHLM